MNIEIANRLLEYRKKNGLSQEELAEKLNISRQSVSKWERGETSPDTDNLIELSKIYGVTIDDLINVNKPLVDNIQIQQETSKNYFIKVKKNHCVKDEEGNIILLKEEGLKVIDKADHSSQNVLWENVFILENDQKRKMIDIDSFGKNSKLSIKSKRIKDTLDALTILLITFLYVLLCSLKIQRWNQFWVIFLAFPTLTTFYEAIAYKDISRFVFPLLIATIYLYIGMYYQKWTPYWFLFFFIPIYYMVIGLVKKKQLIYYVDDNGVQHHFEIDDGDIEVEQYLNDKDD